MLEVDIKTKLKGFELAPVFVSGAKRTALFGASGSGKSMTLKSIAGIERPDEGRIALNGHTLFDRQRRIDLKPQKRRIGYLFQDYALFPNMTALENIKCVSRNKYRITKIADRLGIEELLYQYPSQLSGGQQQRVALARCIVTEPELLLLDEPFSALDGYIRERLRDGLWELLDELDAGSVIVTHDREEAYALSDEIFIIDNGRVIENGATEDVFARPKTVYTARLTGCRNIYGAERLSENSVYVKELDTVLRLNSVPEGTRYIGIRERDISPAEKGGINAVRVRVKSIAKTLNGPCVTFAAYSGGEIVCRTDPAEYISAAPEKLLPLKCNEW